ncbi:flagellar hook protein FlgE [Pengzhenrongella frigida]|uniref:Flagellar hook protein FlgE n=1 Tax=Pengzhenrongella frigida TaxID=1259133 RepID=A0A4Q5MWQ6_9MICO|nr:flagellar hook protein FlgE [Cellulomonas sp. HLT2-17]RYV50016.1 flagellar hook protein FlgE [Cellulomonas sp. HLT2-17]
MLRSLFSGISGLKAHQTMLDVAGNNIANVNTTGFKSSQTQFQDTLSQVLTNAGAAAPGVGGTNPAQVGLGVRVAGITTNFSQGAAQLTNRSTDMMINGDGFFTLRSGNEQFFTRAGSFNFDSLGQLVTPDGALVQGWAAVDGVVNPNGPLTDIKLPISTLMGAEATKTATYVGNLPSDALDGSAPLVKSIDVYDSLGNTRSLKLTFTKAAGDWSVAATDGTATFPVAPATGLVTFDPATGAILTPTTFTIGTAPDDVAVDLSALTGFAGLSTVAAVAQDGQGAGNLQSFSLSPDGTLLGSFSNGLKQAIGQLSMATFTNPTGLEKAGGSMYRTTVSSGIAQVGVAGTGGRGKLAGGSLEMSNVDLSAEFTNLIIAQRGFQANSRVITTSDELLQELVNLKR